MITFRLTRADDADMSVILMCISYVRTSSADITPMGGAQLLHAA